MNASKNKSALYVCNISSLRDADKFNATYEKLSDARKMRVDRCRKADDRLRSAAGEYILNKALSAHGIDLSAEAFSLREHGKPYLTAHPEFNFNISHSGDFVICAVSSQAVGCDVERVTEINPEISRRFSQAEHMQVMAQPDDAARRDMFFRYWVLKESVIKADGRGFSLPLDSFTIKLSEQMKVIIDGENYTLREFDLHPEYYCALCGTAEDIDNAELIIVDL